MFLKNKYIISKIRRSKVTDYAALNIPNIISSFAMQFYQKTKHFFVKMKVEFDQSII